MVQLRVLPLVFWLCQTAWATRSDLHNPGSRSVGAELFKHLRQQTEGVYLDGAEIHNALLKHTEGTPFRPGLMSGQQGRNMFQASLLENSNSSRIDILSYLSAFVQGGTREALLDTSQVLDTRQQLRSGARQEKLDKPDYDTVDVKMPWDMGEEPLVKCPPAGEEARTAMGEADANLQVALKTFCEAGLGLLAEFYVDPRFRGNYERLEGKDGWIDRAFLTYMGLKNSTDRVSGEEDLLVQSVHHFSKEPVVVANFNTKVPSAWTPERFPNMVLMHGRSAQTVGKSFNFNKFTAMLFSKVKTGMILDADQFANHGLDSMLQRAEEETTEEYPFPVMPVHWMSRDPESDDMGVYPDYYTWHFKSKNAPTRTMRWGHAHPTWTHYALPWLAKWTSYTLAPKRTNPPSWLQEQGWMEDEDLMNVGLWADGATKQWCKYDIPSPNDFGGYLKQDKTTQAFRDGKYFPKGIPMVFFTAHDAKKPEESYKWLARLWEDGDDKRKAIFYDGKWFGSGTTLKGYDSSLKCIA